MYEVDAIALLARDVLRARAPVLIAETCAWSVGLSDRPHHIRRHGRITATGSTLDMRAEADQQLGGEEDARLELADAPAGRLYDEDGSDPVGLVRAAEWEAPLKTEAEQLLLAALADVPLVEVEAEGLPLSLVRAAEAETRAAAPVVAPDLSPPDVSGALFLAEVALQEAELPLPVPPEAAPQLLKALAAEGIDPDEVLVLLPHLPVLQDTAEQVAEAVERELRRD